MGTRYNNAPYSSSKLVVASCPARFKAQYIDKTLKDTSSQRSKKGNVIHECFEDLIIRMADNEKIATKEIEDIILEKLRAYNITDIDLVTECRESVMNFMLHSEFPLDLSTLVGTEEMLAVKKDENFNWVQCEWTDPDAIYRGKIDVLCVDDDSIGTIIDHKTQKNIEKSANTFQMSTYAFLVMKCYPNLRGVRSIIHYADPTLNFFSKAYEFSPSEINMTEEKIMSEIELIESLESYDHNLAGGQCAFCPMLGECSIYLSELEKAKKNQGAIARLPITDAVIARDFAEIITVVEKLLAGAKKSLQDYCKKYEVSVALKGREYGFTPSMKWAPKTDEDKKHIMDILEKNGQDPMAYCKIDMTALKKSHLFLHKEPIDEILKHIEQVYSTSFRGKKL